MFTDTHCHLYKEYYDNIDEVIKESHKENVDKYIISGTTFNNSLEGLELADKYDECYCTVGLHPEDITDGELEKIIDLIKKNKDNKKMVAIGEIGLDYHWNKENKEVQIEVFEEQLKLAQELGLPVIIHAREATMDTLNIIKKYNVIGVLHSYSGSLEIAKEYIKRGFYFGSEISGFK